MSFNTSPYSLPLPEIPTLRGDQRSPAGKNKDEGKRRAFLAYNHSTKQAHSDEITASVSEESSHLSVAQRLKAQPHNVDVDNDHSLKSMGGARKMNPSLSDGKNSVLYSSASGSQLKESRKLSKSATLNLHLTQLQRRFDACDEEESTNECAKLSTTRARSHAQEVHASKGSQLKGNCKVSDHTNFNLVPLMPSLPSKYPLGELGIDEAQRWEKLWYQTVGVFLVASETDRGIDQMALENAGFTLCNEQNNPERVVPEPKLRNRGLRNEEGSETLIDQQSELDALSLKLNELLSISGIPTSVDEFLSCEMDSLITPPKSKLDDELAMLSVDSISSRAQLSTKLKGWNQRYFIVSDILSDSKDSAGRTKRIREVDGQPSEIIGVKKKNESLNISSSSYSDSNSPSSEQLKDNIDGSKQRASLSRSHFEVLQKEAPPSQPDVSNSLRETMRRYHLPPINVSRRMPEKSQLMCMSPRDFSEPRPVSLRSMNNNAENESVNGFQTERTVTNPPESSEAVVPEPAPWLELGIDVGASSDAQIQTHLKIQSQLWDQASINTAECENICKQSRHLRTLRVMIELLQNDMMALRKKIELSNESLRRRKEEKIDEQQSMERELAEAAAQKDQAQLESLIEKDRTEVLQGIWKWMKSHRPAQAHQFLNSPHRQKLEDELKMNL